MPVWLKIFLSIMGVVLISSATITTDNTSMYDAIVVLCFYVALLSLVFLPWVIK